MVTLITAIHVIAAVFLVLVVLLQSGKGASMGASFGGASQTVFGASGAGNLLTKVTWICALVFLTTSIILAYSSAKRTSGSIFEGKRFVPAAVASPASKAAKPATSGTVASPAAKGSASPVARPAASASAAGHR